ncbi:MAG: kinase/pyrophosphorylase [Anaerolineae bacterium]|nr:kinase/pyrophosphorylase [Anaerolineae bacterium]
MQPEAPYPPIFVVTGSLQSVGEQLVHTILAQFQGADVPIKTFFYVREVNQLEPLIMEAVTSNAIIVHTMVSSTMRQALVSMAQAHGIMAIDLAGPLMDYLSGLLGQEPAGLPGLYHTLHETEFKRNEAVEFTLGHDDGVKAEEWGQADIVLLGVSRVYKTPLSVYLAMLTWKVVNVPIVLNVPPRQALFDLDRRRVVGLTIDPDQLLHHRQHRQRQLGVQGRSQYVEPLKLYEELEYARNIYRRGGFATVDVTNKPIETTADEVVAAVLRRLKSET